MKKLRKLFCSVLVVSMLLSMNMVAFASESSDNGAGETVASTMIYMPSDDETARIPNAIEVSVILVDDNHVKVSIANFGIDKFDKVSCYVEIWDRTGIKQYANTIAEEDIYPLFPRNNTLYVKNWSKIKITNIQCWDGKDYGTVADVEYTKN